MSQYCLLTQLTGLLILRTAGGCIPEECAGEVTFKVITAELAGMTVAAGNPEIICIYYPLSVAWQLLSDVYWC